MFHAASRVHETPRAGREGVCVCVCALCGNLDWGDGETARSVMSPLQHSPFSLSPFFRAGWALH